MSNRSAGRPHNKNRQAALLVGDRTYQGKRCKRCGNTERYTKSWGCITCQKASGAEARALLRAARLENQNSGLDFLDATRTTHLPSSYNPNKKEEVVKERPIQTTVLPPSQLIANPDTTIDGSTAASPPTVGASPDPEPLCPECGCNVEADHEQIKGWLHRVSPWRCTICEWEDPVNPPAIQKLDGLDFLD